MKNNCNADINIELTPTDRLILASYCDMLDGLSRYLGDGYEIVLHSLEDCSHSAIKVINGFHTGRTEGAPITDLALTMLERIKNQQGAEKSITYFVKNKRGEPLKSTTIAITGENQRILGLLCINFYLNTAFGDFVKDFLFEETSERGSSLALQNENFSANSVELVEHMVEQLRDEVMADPSISLSNKNKEIIHRLYAKGIFNLKDAVLKAAQILNISKNTVYLHLRHIEQE